MKKKLLLLLSPLNLSDNIPISSTLAWLCQSQNILFDLYYDSYHLGVHFPGGDSRGLDLGQRTGGTVCGDRHFEEFYRTILNFDLSVAVFKDSIFHSSLKNLNIDVVSRADRFPGFYKDIFGYLGAPWPENVVMVGTRFDRSLDGLEAYLYPEIYYRQALGVPDSLDWAELGELCERAGKIFCLYVDETVIVRLKNSGFDVEVIDRIGKEDDYLKITKRIAERWAHLAKGWMLGDPTLVAHWVPKATEEGLIAVYSVPQEGIVQAMGDMISGKGRVVYGRQSSDRDFFELSKRNSCFQVIDPCRPPFQSAKHVEYRWPAGPGKDGFYHPEFTDEELVQLARQGRILISLMFWSGMIREIANFHNLMDLLAMTRLRCGIVLTAPSFEYMMHAPLEMLTIPWEKGGVFPFVEPVLGSCGLGVGIESLITQERLGQDLKEALSRILAKVGHEAFLPKGWWATLDADLERLSLRKRPKPFRLQRYPPRFQFRFQAQKYSEGLPAAERRALDFLRRPLIAGLKKKLSRAGWTKFFLPYRPYEAYRAGEIREDIIETVKAAGLEYMFTKSGFQSLPEVKYMDREFVALNYTSGQWDGWTPFETINDVTDLRKSEKFLLRRRKPGWIVSTIDTCLWTFGGEFWRRGHRLFEIARFCAEGGQSKRLVNVRPHTVARYARIVADL